MEMTLSEAATWAGVTRPTIHKALTKGRLSGRREGNEWRIDPAELARVFQPAAERHSAGNSSVSSTDIGQLIAEKDRIINLLQETVQDTRQQRDKAMALAEQAQTELAKAQVRLLAHETVRAPAEPAQRGSMLEQLKRRLTGRKG